MHLSDSSGAVVLFFDLPVGDKAQRRKYTGFRKFLKKEGYMALQESVYIKLLRNYRTYPSEVLKAQNHAPDEGRLSLLPLHIREFSRLITICGQPFDMELFCADVISI